MFFVPLTADRSPREDEETAGTADYADDADWANGQEAKKKQLAADGRRYTQMEETTEPLGTKKKRMRNNSREPQMDTD